LDRLFDVLDPDVPRVKCFRGGEIHPNVVFGLNVKQSAALIGPDGVNTAEHREYDVIEVHTHNDTYALDADHLGIFLGNAPSDLYRIKGFVPLADGTVAVVNWAFGRYRQSTTADKHHLALMLVGRDLLPCGKLVPALERWICDGLAVDALAIRIQQQTAACACHPLQE
jgi:G3E family GTPase